LCELRLFGRRSFVVSVEMDEAMSVSATMGWRMIRFRVEDLLVNGQRIEGGSAAAG
jgi:hypothetical protein